MLIIILVLSFLLRTYHLNIPNSYVFDEVYHAFTAKEYLSLNKDAWNPFATAPQGVAYEWLHPPVAKEIMTASMFVLNSTNPWAWRMPGAIFGTLTIYLVYLLTLKLFENKNLAIISAFIYSIDGLSLVQSRTGMNDIYLTCFVVASMLFFAQKRYFISAILAGLATATKWPGIFLIGIYFLLLLNRHQIKYLAWYIYIIPMIYVFSYLPYFLQGYTLYDFIELHKQIWWYQTNLKATHDYASAWWSWPLNLYPIWYHVEYKGDLVSNIFASGNPMVFLLGFIAVVLSVWDYIKNKSFSLLLILCGYFSFWLPWIFSPRIMFLYHYTPSLPFLSIALGYQLNFIFKKNPKFVIFILTLIIINFIALYPFLIGIPMSRNLLNMFFWTNITKNPFF